MTPRHPSPTASWLPRVGCLLALVAFGCDDAGETRKDTGSPTQPGQTSPDGKAVDSKAAPATGLPKKFKNPAEAITAYNKCYSDCFGLHVKATDRETCKLDCDGLAEVGQDSLTDPAAKVTYTKTWQTLRGCVTGCFEDKSLNATNRQTCLLTCSDEAEVEALPTIGTPPAGTGTTPPAGTGTTPPAGTTPPTKVVPLIGTTPPAGTAPTKVTPTPTPTTPAAPTKK